MHKHQRNQRKDAVHPHTKKGTYCAGLTINDKVLVPSNERQQIGCGLVNYKNNCFFNAIIQALFHSPAFLKCLEETEGKHVDCVTCCVNETYKEMKSITQTRIPWKLYNLLKLKIGNLFNGKQQDAHEFLEMLIDKMNVPLHNASSVTNIFQGEVTSIVKCSECCFKSETTKIFTTLQIHISGNASISDALKKYFDVENVVYKCDRCKHEINAKKKFTIANAPSLLCLQLLRFSDSKTKITSSIQILNTIDVSQYLGDEQREEKLKTVYKLVAVVNHKGPHLNQGHYSTITKNASSWYEFDDSHVFRITNTDGNFRSGDAYILLYEVMDNKETTGDVLKEYTPFFDTEKANNCPDEYAPIETIDDTNDEIQYDSIEETPDDSDELIPVEIIDDTDTEATDLMVNSNELVSESETKSLYVDSPDSSNINCVTEECDKLSGRRIVEINYVLKQMQEMTTNICKKCNEGNMIFERETKRGLISIFTFRCSSCEKIVKVNSCSPKKLCQSTVNESAVLGIVSIGLGFYHLQEFLAHMDVNCMSYSTFHRLDGKLQADWWKLAKQFEAEALNEEIRLAKADNKVDSADNALIEAEIDGSWCKRSFGNNFSSLSGCAAIIGRRTNKIIYSGEKNKYCHICKIAESKEIAPRFHDCKANYVGPSSGMETEIIVDGFKFCNEKGARFNLLVGDGDSSTYKAIRDLSLYKDPDMDTEKLQCENHVFKNFNKKCGNLHTDTRLNKTGRKLLPSNIGKKISKGVRMAAKYWRESDIDPAEKYEHLEKDIMNAPLHYFGIHEDCADYFCDKETDPEAYGSVAVLKESGIYYELMDICQFYLSNNAKSLIAGLSTNHTEGFNSLICKTLGGKRVCNSLDGDSYNARTSIAKVQYNTKGHAGSTFHEITYGGDNKSCVKLENTRKRKVRKNAIYKENRSKKRKLEEKPTKEKTKPTRYGLGREEIDFEGSVYEVAKQRTLEKLKENQNNRKALVIETKAQRNSFKWMTTRRNLLTSSYFSRILKAKNRKSYSKIVEDIIHNNVEYSNTAELRHERWYRREALELFAQLYGSEPISQCGIFIDPEYCFIGVTPFRLYGEDGIVVPKCPKKAFKMSIDEAFNKKLIPIWQGSLQNREINRKSHWYYEIQGQLHVTRKRIAYLIIYLGESIYEVIELERNDKFWKEEMEKELVFFYNEALLKEVVNSRYDRGMEFRKYDTKSQTFL